MLVALVLSLVVNWLFVGYFVTRKALLFYQKPYERRGMIFFVMWLWPFLSLLLLWDWLKEEVEVP